MQLNEYLVKHIDEIKPQNGAPMGAIAALYLADRERLFVVRGDFFTRFANFLTRSSVWTGIPDDIKHIKTNIANTHKNLVGKRKERYANIFIGDGWPPSVSVQDDLSGDEGVVYKETKYFTAQEIKAHEAEICKYLNY